MTKLKISLVVALVIAGVALSLALKHSAENKILEKDKALLLQGKQLAELTGERQRLSNQVATTKSSNGGVSMAEVAKLRGEAEKLRQQTHELRQQQEQKNPKTSSSSSPKAASHPPEYYEQLHRMAGGKPIDARNLATVFASYASDHDQFPTNFNQVISYLRKEKMSLSGTNQFDIVYQGSLDRLKNIPMGSVAVIRSQTFLTPDGKAARVYGIADGSSQIVSSDDNFKAWEAEHILPPPTPGQP
jgi:hypothetical protein